MISTGAFNFSQNKCLCFVGSLLLKHVLKCAKDDGNIDSIYL